MNSKNFRRVSDTFEVFIQSLIASGHVPSKFFGMLRDAFSELERFHGGSQYTWSRTVVLRQSNATQHVELVYLAFFCILY